jgi:hypothetical protein
MCTEVLLVPPVRRITMVIDIGMHLLREKIEIIIVSLPTLYMHSYGGTCSPFVSLGHRFAVVHMMHNFG